MQLGNRMARLKRLEVELDGVTSSRDLHAVLSRALGFPVWYGANWDAFGDAITGLVDMPVQLVFSGWQGLATRFPEDAEHLSQCLLGMQAQYPTLAPVKVLWQVSTVDAVSPIERIEFAIASRVHQLFSRVVKLGSPMMIKTPSGDWLEATLNGMTPAAEVASILQGDLVLRAGFPAEDLPVGSRVFFVSL